MNLAKYIGTVVPIAAVMLLCFTTPARSDIPATETFQFTGACTDCFSGNGNATATLVLDGSYSLGDQITSSNFVSFMYYGTDLVGPFTIASPDEGAVYGDLSAVPGPNSFYVLAYTDIWGDYQSFETDPGGSWQYFTTGDANYLQPPDDGGAPADYGSSSTWVAAVPAPEPGFTFLVLLGMLGPAMKGRIRRKARS